MGSLREDDHGEPGFEYAEAWLANPAARPLSQSLPLNRRQFTRKECTGFFAGLLPDEAKRKSIGRNLGISANNDVAMLKQIGGEFAGAVTFLPPGQRPEPPSAGRYRPLTPAALAELLRLLPRRPLLAGEDGIRLSLAGAQDKIPVQVAGTTIALPLGNSPRTHILKPAIERFPGLVFNEALCLRLAAAIGLAAAPVTPGRVEDVDYLLVERYDRIWVPGAAPTDRAVGERLHQEDFCQALGIFPQHKYQNEGGPSLAQCFALIRAASAVPVQDLQAPLDAVIFYFLIGNHDAHGKNFSLLYHRTGPGLRLAPLYDLVSTVYYPELSPKMAMKIGGEYGSEKVFPPHFERFAAEVGLAPRGVRARLLELVELILARLPGLVGVDAVTVAVAALVRNRCELARQNFRR